MQISIKKQINMIEKKTKKTKRILLNREKFIKDLIDFRKWK